MLIAKVSYKKLNILIKTIVHKFQYNVYNMDQRYAENLSWHYHTIPFITGIIGLFLGNIIVENSGPLLKTIFPAIGLIIGGFGGLIILGYISDRQNK